MVIALRGWPQQLNLFICSFCSHVIGALAVRIKIFLEMLCLTARSHQAESNSACCMKRCISVSLKNTVLISVWLRVSILPVVAGSDSAPVSLVELSFKLCQAYFCPITYSNLWSITTSTLSFHRLENTRILIEQ